MDDFRIGAPGFVDWQTGRTNDGSKKRARQRQAEPQEDLTDQVSLSSTDEPADDENADLPPGYSPASSDEEPN